MSRHDPLLIAAHIMEAFARSTGLEPEGAERRYLWTDAFAVCNYLGLHGVTGEERYRELAVRLIDRVHHVLGRHREDDERDGWISGLAEEEGERHPTAGGLRIGKPHGERGPSEPYDPDLEWDRDGQYYHYLTRWMHALACAARATGEERFGRWAAELARAAHRAFAHGSGPRQGLYWKMSIDLSRPLVPSMGQHDALDGYVTMREVAAEAPAGTEPLAREISELRAMCRDAPWATRDPLGIGGLLTDALLLAGFPGPDHADDQALLRRLLSASATSLVAFERTRELERPAVARLPFREFGLSIGLVAAGRLAGSGNGQGDTLAVADVPVGAAARLRPYLAMRERIEAFWLEPVHRESPTWTGHHDINAVMLATSLAPEGYLGR